MVVGVMNYEGILQRSTSLTPTNNVVEIDDEYEEEDAA